MAVGRDVIILMLAWLLQEFSETSKLPEPVNVTLTSRNFIHLLTWQPGLGTPRGVSYNVSVKSNRDRSWQPVAGCVLVEHPLVCNLTRAFAEPTYVYYNRVVAILQSQASNETLQHGFKPIKNSELDSPRLTLAACDQSLCVDLHPPWETLRHIYQRFQYQLRVTSSTSSQPVEFFVSNRSLDRVVLRDLAPGQQYCVSVRILDSLVPRKSRFSEPQCTFTNTMGVRTEDVFISVGLCLVAVLVLAIVVLLVQTGVICLKNPLPSVLTFIHPLGKRRLAVSRKELVCSHVHIRATAPSAGRKGKCAVRADDSVGEEEEGTSAESFRGYKLPSTTSSSSSSFSSFSSSCSSFSTHPLLAPPLQSDRPSRGHVNPHMCARLAPYASHRRSELRADASTAPRSVAVATLDQHALQLPRRVDPLAPSMEKEAVAGVGPWEGVDDVNLLSLTCGERGEGWAYRATAPQTADEEEEEEETAISDDKVDEEQPNGYLRR